MKKPHVWSLLILSTAAMATPPSTPPATPPGRVLSRAQLAQARRNFRLANRRLEQANTNLLEVCDNQEKRLNNIKKTLEGSPTDQGLIAQLNGQRAEQVSGREPFVMELRTALDEAARLEFNDNLTVQPSKKRGVLAAYAVVIEQLEQKKVASDRLADLNSKKAALVTALGDLQRKVTQKENEYNTWNTSAIQDLVESAREKRLLGTRLSSDESAALNYEEKYQEFKRDSGLLKLSLEAEKLFFEEEIADLSATPPSVTSLATRRSQLQTKRFNLGQLRAEITQNQGRIRGYDGRIDDIDRQLLRLNAAARLTIDPICAEIKPAAPN